MNMTLQYSYLLVNQIMHGAFYLSLFLIMMGVI